MHAIEFYKRVLTDLVLDRLPSLLEIAFVNDLFLLTGFTWTQNLFFYSSFCLLLNCSPNMLFLSPSLLTAAPSTQIRLSHEISHAWFGLHIGARIWTEEWLSEGFATYCEDRIDCLARQVSMAVHPAGGTCILLFPIVLEHTVSMGAISGASSTSYAVPNRPAAYNITVPNTAP